MSESKFRLYFRALLRKNGVWTASVEQSRGGTAGFPDFLVRRSETLLPVELKAGDIDLRLRLVHSSRIRPAQIRLLNELFEVGIVARLIIGTPDPSFPIQGHWQVWMLRDVSRASLLRWRKGFPERDLTLIAVGDRLVIPVEEW